MATALPARRGICLSLYADVSCIRFEGLTLSVARLCTRVGVAGIAHGRVTVDEHLRRGASVRSPTQTVSTLDCTVSF